MVINMVCVQLVKYGICFSYLKDIIMNKTRKENESKQNIQFILFRLSHWSKMYVVLTNPPQLLRLGSREYNTNKALHADSVKHQRRTH